MRTQIKNLVVAMVVTLSIGAVANAQQNGSSFQQNQLQTRVAPGQQFVAPPQAQNRYYFGLRLELVRCHYNGTTLRVVDVTWNSPAQRAGLEVGDEIRTVNGRDFRNANNSFAAVAMMSQFVDAGYAVPAVAAGVQAYVMPGPPQRVANMIVRNVRTGQNVSVTVRPTLQGFGSGSAPGIAASSFGS
jgi:S1-C subfamily serine protease